MELQKLIYQYFGQASASYDLYRYLHDIGEVYLLGGVARELYNYKYSKNSRITPVRDIDIVVNLKENYQLLDSLMKNFPYKLNRFGGYKIEINNVKIDIWEIQKTWAYRNNIIKYGRNNMGLNLQNTVFLNYDAIIYYSNKNRFYSKKYKECLEKKVLDIVLSKNPEVYLNLLRTIEFKVKTGYSLSPRLMELFYTYYIHDRDFIERLYMIENYRANMLTKSDIKREAEIIITNFRNM